jgi:hypothetical protein
MSEEKFIEDDLDRMLFYRIPSSGVCFEDIGMLSTIYTQWMKRRKARKQERSKVENKIVVTENKVETIKV